MIRNSVLNMKQILELYIHIPFCIRKCRYCDFLSAPQDEETRERYVEALLREISAHRDKRESYEVSTVFFGGGTPSVLSPSQVKRIFEALQDSFAIHPDAEISMEANPGTVTEEKLRTYRACGINRISFGLQSADNEELRLLGRIHTYEEFEENFRLARKCGFDNINVDLMSAIPRQTMDSLERTLAKVISLGPEHISAYSLIVEEGTPFFNLYGERGPLESELPGEEEERQMYYRTKEMLAEAGYQRYEISNYATQGKECRHNLGYWERANYLGLGLGSSSLMDNVRFRNTEDLEFYLKNSGSPKSIQRERAELSVKEQMEEFIFLGLRKMEGISAEEFKACFHRDIKEVYEKQIDHLMREGLLWRRGDRIFLTEKGIDVSNCVFAEFLE